MQAVRETHSTLFLIIITIYKLTQLKPALPVEADMSHMCIHSCRYHVHTSRYIYYIIQPIALSYNIVILCNLETLIVEPKIISFVSVAAFVSHPASALGTYATVGLLISLALLALSHIL